jgi:dipeptidyl aminopeptidase/acylaminoacyl peptidase
MTALVPDAAGFDSRCLVDDDQPWSGKIPEAPKIAAVINWFGPTDLTGMIRERRSYAVSWLSSPVDEAELAKRVSPITYVRPRTPPVLTIHGDLDQLVPYADSVRFHEALEKAGVKNELITVAGAKHGEFSDEQMLRAYAAVQRFLRQL